MTYENIVTGQFIQRVNRFVAEILIDGVLTTVHVKNTGRCKELFIEGVTVYLEPAKNPDRKTKFSLIGIEKAPFLINIDSQIPNAVVEEVLKAVQEYQKIGRTDYPNIALIQEFSNFFPGLQLIIREKTYGKSRFDVYYELENGTKGFIEVKGVTLEDQGIARFPDAPTSRGTKHILELKESLEDGYKSYIFFVIQLSPVKWFEPNKVTDKVLSDALVLAQKAGLGIFCYDSIITEDTIYLNQQIPVKL